MCVCVCVRLMGGVREKRRENGGTMLVPFPVHSLSSRRIRLVRRSANCVCAETEFESVSVMVENVV